VIRRWVSSWRERRQLEVDAVRIARSFFARERPDAKVLEVGGIVAVDGDSVIVRVCWSEPRIPPPYELVRVEPDGAARWVGEEERESLVIGPWR